jgi:hypothetical protein
MCLWEWLAYMTWVRGGGAEEPDGCGAIEFAPLLHGDDSSATCDDLEIVLSLSEWHAAVVDPVYIDHRRSYVANPKQIL